MLQRLFERGARHGDNGPEPPLKVGGASDKVLAGGFPGADLQSSLAGPPENVQFMVKDSKRYAATGGWGFANFTNGKAGDKALHETCFACHEPAKDRDYVLITESTP